MIKTIMFAAAALAAACFADARNLIKNGDFSNGYEGFGFSDAAPESLGVKIEESPHGNALSYSVSKNGLGGLNFSEVHVDRNSAYEFSFWARADKKAKIRLIAFAEGDTIYRHELKKFDISPEWTLCKFVLNPSKKKLRKMPNGSVIEQGIVDWVPFRIEKIGSDAARISLADFRFFKLGKDKRDADNVGNPALSAKISFDLTPPFFEKIARKFSEKSVSDSAIFWRNSNAKIRIVFDNPAQARKAELSWRIFDKINGVYLPNVGGASQIDISEGVSVSNFDFSVPSKNGIYLFEAYIDGAKIADSRFAVSPKIRAGTGKLPVDTGYCGVITNGEKGSPSPEEMAFLADSGISWIRTWDGGNPFNWRVIEPKEGQFNWTVADETVRLANINGIGVMPVLGGMFFIYPPDMGLRGHRQASWLYKKSEVVRTIKGFERQGRKAIKPPLADWERMVRAIAERYDGKIKYFEVMNEPNIIWGDYSTYYPYLESAYKVLKSANPENKVVGFSTTGDFGGNMNGFLGTMLKMGAGKFCDAVSFHSYGTLFEDTKRRGDVAVSNFKTALAENNVKVPLIQSELYYLNPLCKGGGDHFNGPRFHAGYLARRYLLDAANGVKASILVPAGMVAVVESCGGVDAPNFAKSRKMPYPSCGAKIIHANPKYIVGAVFAQLLYDTKFAQKSELKNSWLGYGFSKKSGGGVFAIFALDSHIENLDDSVDTPKTKVVDSLNRASFDMGVPPEGVKFYDVFGNEISRSTDGKIVLPVSPIPVYVESGDFRKLGAYIDSFKK